MLRETRSQTNPFFKCSLIFFTGCIANIEAFFHIIIFSTKQRLKAINSVKVVVSIVFLPIENLILNQAFGKGSKGSIYTEKFQKSLLFYMNYVEKIYIKFNLLVKCLIIFLFPQKSLLQLAQFSSESFSFITL